MRQAYKVAYLGSGFHGSQRQPGLRTVEGDLLTALGDEGVLADPREARFRMASRTDRGVSALGNVVAFDAAADPRSVLADVNPRLDDVWLYAYARTPEGFNPRRALERWYRCHLPGDLPLGRLEAAAPLFLGHHDFRAFTKGHQEGACEVTSLTVRKAGRWVLLDVRADRFRWEMVRRLARALELHARGDLSPEDLRRGLEGERMDLEPVAPERLILMDVRYAFAFTPFTARGLRTDVRARRRIRALEEACLDALLGRVEGGGGKL